MIGIPEELFLKAVLIIGFVMGYFACYSIWIISTSIEKWMEKRK